MITDDDLQYLDDATTLFETVLGGGTLDEARPSRCPGWSTRDVANHVLGGAIRYAHYFSGADPAEVFWTRTAEIAGDDPIGTHRRLAAVLRGEFDAHRDDGIVLPHPIQAVDAPTLLVMRVQELALHTWDIAAATDPDVVLDPSLCRFLLDRGEPVRTILRSADALGPATTPVGDGLTAQVLAAWGRG
ncbi:maleylpyruvate isomerase family mycothiol-dependent enzyme [Prescottella subtropica]|uniref:maleylpyruvate isomerase family mycothiol-dependent enzyme n=1 Tax=Prescottella subtropica TaxID=2545757 RepID=UPI0010F56504|nr:maleylpyruvate isomerase family mycothiol-dependent enzyme [Prescottella subtropica]